jgi:hypothetical protein
MEEILRSHGPRMCRSRTPLNAPPHQQRHRRQASRKVQVRRARGAVEAAAAAEGEAAEVVVVVVVGLAAVEAPEGQAELVLHPRRDLSVARAEPKLVGPAPTRAAAWALTTARCPGFLRTACSRDLGMPWTGKVVVVVVVAAAR